MINLGSTKLGLPLHGYLFNLSLPESMSPHDPQNLLTALSQSVQKFPRVLFIGGVHGDEPEGVVASRGLLEKLRQQFNYNLELLLVPEMNPEGVLLKTRGNSNKVDLNRNLPTKDWSPVAATERYNPGPNPLSEIENQILVKLIESFKPQVIYSLHSWKPMLNTNGDLPEAQVISQLTGYKIEPDIGYPTPGSLGTYASFERKIPTLTYEVERDISFKPIIDIHVPALLAGLKISEQRTF